ncbi:MAG: terminase large subunit domain-containing protein [Elusimicrobiota bacterium]
MKTPTWLDDWQKEIVNYKGNICLRSGRQVGKSTAIAIKAVEFAASNKNKSVMIIAHVDRQSRLLLEKVLFYMEKYHKRLIKTGKERPTRHKIQLRNGSIIRALPAGISGSGIRGFTVDMLIADEAAFIYEDVWSAVTPMLAVTGGDLILLSTPFKKEGFYYSCFDNDDFKAYHISSEDCPRISKSFLDSEKKRMTKAEYAREYLGEFSDNLMQLFPTSLINQSCVIPSKESIDKENVASVIIPETSTINLAQSFSLSSRRKFFLGVDFAGRGGDENSFVVVSCRPPEKILKMEEVQTTTYEKVENNITGDTIERIKRLDKKYKFNKIYVDDGGLGFPIFEVLKEDDQVGRRMVAINNARRSLNRDKTKAKTILKNDLYSNLLNMMETGKVKLLNDDNVKSSLQSIQYEYTEEGRIKISGRYSHITEGLIRAAWGLKENPLNIWIR